MNAEKFRQPLATQSVATESGSFGRMPLAGQGDFKMAKWTTKSDKPLTTERRVLVANSHGQEGWAHVKHDGLGPRLIGVVYSEVRCSIEVPAYLQDRREDGRVYHSVTGEELGYRIEQLDGNPQFVASL